MLKEIREYINGYEGIDFLYVEFLDEKAEPNTYAIFVEPLFNIGLGSGVLKHYGNNYKYKEYRFQLQIVNHYEQRLETSYDNAQFLDDFAQWIKENNRNKVFPEIEGMQKIETTNSGYIEAVASDNTKAVYTIGLRLEYLEKGEI